jgi:hypothetical protein
MASHSTVHTLVYTPIHSQRTYTRSHTAVCECVYERVYELVNVRTFTPSCTCSPTHSHTNRGVSLQGINPSCSGAARADALLRDTSKEEPGIEPATFRQSGSQTARRPLLSPPALLYVQIHQRGKESGLKSTRRKHYRALAPRRSGGGDRSDASRTRGR